MTKEQTRHVGEERRWMRVQQYIYIYKYIIREMVELIRRTGDFFVTQVVSERERERERNI